jgi:hypothetical protein
MKKPCIVKLVVTAILLASAMPARAQTLQVHYDLRHTIAPATNPKNYPTLYFEYFKIPDTGWLFVKPGSFLFKMQADLAGDKANIGKFYMQVSQQVRFWRPKIFISLQYSGGFGITEPKQYSYYIVNTYTAGLSVPFKLGNAYLSTSLSYKYVPYAKPSADPTYSLYFYKGLFNYRAEFSGDFSIWTENRDYGDSSTEVLTGKRFYFFAEPQLWYNLNKSVSVGSKINMYYHINTPTNVLNIYPTAALRLKL